MSDIDSTLRESLGRLAEPGDPSGVAEAVAAKASVAGAGAGGAGAGFTAWVIPAVVAIAALGAGALASQAFGSDAGAPATVAVALPANGSVPGAACPGGAASTQLDPGARVIAMQRSEDGAFLAVRDPGNLSSLVWVAASYAIPDASTDGLPVGGCDEASDPIASASPSASPSPSVSPSASPTETSEPEPEPEPTETSEPEPEPEPEPEDTEKPTIQVGNWDVPPSPNNYICTMESDFGDKSAQIQVFVADNVGVKTVSASSSTPGVSISGPSGSGGTRTFTVSRSGNTDAVINLTFTVKDAAGNSRTANSPGLQSYGPGNCLG